MIFFDTIRDLRSIVYFQLFRIWVKSWGKPHRFIFCLGFRPCLFCSRMDGIMSNFSCLRSSFALEKLNTIPFITRHFIVFQKNGALKRFRASFNREWCILSTHRILPKPCRLNKKNCNQHPNSWTLGRTERRVKLRGSGGHFDVLLNPEP